MCVSRVTLLYVLCLVQCVCAENDTIKPVYFSLILSKGEYGLSSWDAIPAIDIALKQIKKEKLLPDYDLTYESEKDSLVIRGLYTTPYHLQKIIAAHAFLLLVHTVTV